MKLFKRIGAAILSLAIIMSFGAFTASADASSPKTLTLTSSTGTTLSNYSFDAFKIVSWTPAKDASGNVIFTNPTINTDYRSDIATYLTQKNPAADVSSDAKIVDSMNNYIKTNAAAFANFLASIKKTRSANTDNGVFTDLDYGYYLVIETADNANDGYLLSDPILISVPDASNNAAVAKIKNTPATIEKKIIVQDPENPAGKLLVDSSTAALGDTINYQSVSDVPFYSTNAITSSITYKVTDTLSDGLTLNSNDISVIVVDASGNETLLPSSNYVFNQTGQTFTLDFANTDAQKANIVTLGAARDKVKVLYSATLNSNGSGVQFGSTGNPNEVKLKYGPDNSNETGWDTVITYTTKLKIHKIDDLNKVVVGAIFNLKGDNGIDYSKPTDSNGDVTFDVLKPGNYTLTETSAPDGLKLIDPITFTISANNGSAIPDPNFLVNGSDNANLASKVKATWSVTKDPNNWFTVDTSTTENVGGTISAQFMDSKGFQLPLSGGVGTAVFTGSGIALVAVAGVLLLVYNKKRKAANH